jgi:hypothetical protein
MNPDDLKRAWQAQTSHSRVRVDAELLLNEIRHNQRAFTATIFWRDVREVGVSLLLVPVWLFLGLKSSLPWTWYLTVPALLWIAGFMLVDRKRQRRQQLEPSEALCRSVASSLAQVEHQIWLLRNVHWWYLLPIALSILAFFVQVTWQTRSDGWSTAIAFTGVVTIAAVVFAGIYCLNQYAVRAELEPRRQELQAIFAHLTAADEPRAGESDP